MPAITFLSDWEVRNGRTVEGDKDCDELLQEFRAATGEDWIIVVRVLPKMRRRWHRLGWKQVGEFKVYTLYADCHGEWQVMNLVTPNGGSNFYLSNQSREDVMNYMLGYLAGMSHERRVSAKAA